MLKVTRQAGFTCFSKREAGRSVNVSAYPEDSVNILGVVQVTINRRLTPEVMGDRRTITPLACTVRKGRSLETTFFLSPDAAYMLRETLSATLDKAVLIEASKEKTS